jgi:hypothetical protein
MIKLLSLFCVVSSCVLLPLFSYADSYPLGKIDPEILATQQGNEKLVYKVSWTGGIKIGNIWMEVNRLDETGTRFELLARVKDSGIFHFFYPVNDSFVTIVDGKTRLPVDYKVIQEEGSSYKARRHTEYDQESGKISYQKNEQEKEYFQVKGGVHNEFSSFFMTRLLHLDPEYPVLVPTFADGTRHDVVVQTGQPLRINKTARGDVNVLPVTPMMEFKGLYDKDGDTVIWFTNDECRVPVRINSKILIGSLTAELVSYSNPFCKDQSVHHTIFPEADKKREKLELGD